MMMFTWLLPIIKSIAAPAVVAIAFTAATTYFLDRLKVKREAVTGLSVTLRDELVALQSLGAEYWAYSAREGDGLREALIMSGLEAVSAGLRAFQNERRLSLSANLDDWIVALRDCMTGGSFQTISREPNFARIQLSATKIAKMRYKLFNERLKRI